MAFLAGVLEWALILIFVADITYVFTGHRREDRKKLMLATVVGCGCVLLFIMVRIFQFFLR